MNLLISYEKIKASIVRYLKYFGSFRRNISSSRGRIVNADFAAIFLSSAEQIPEE